MNYIRSTFLVQRMHLSLETTRGLFEEENTVACTKAKRWSSVNWYHQFVWATMYSLRFQVNDVCYVVMFRVKMT